MATPKKKPAKKRALPAKYRAKKNAGTKSVTSRRHQTDNKRKFKF